MSLGIDRLLLFLRKIAIGLALDDLAILDNSDIHTIDFMSLQFLFDGSILCPVRGVRPAASGLLRRFHIASHRMIAYQDGCNGEKSGNGSGSSGESRVHTAPPKLQGPWVGDREGVHRYSDTPLDVDAPPSVHKITAVF